MILEIRTYRLVPGSLDEFVALMRDQSVPLLHQAGIRVVDCGASLVAESGHQEAFLIRAFATLHEHQAQEEQFYASDAWMHGLRAAIMPLIVSYHSIVIEASQDAISALQRRWDT